MPSISIKVLPKDSTKYFQESIDMIYEKRIEKSNSLSSQLFNKNLKKPRSGFDHSSFSIMKYGIKATYIIEKEINIPTVDGIIKEYQKIEVPGIFIPKQGIILISNSSESIIEKVSIAWAELLFPEKLIVPTTLQIPKEKFSEIRSLSARIVIQISHTESKGLEEIKLRGYDITNKEWYKEEGFNSDSTERFDFIPSLPDDFGNRTTVCRMYRNGRFVIYYNSKFSESEFEDIQLFLIKKIAEVLGSPLCNYGATDIQEKLNI